MKKSKQLKRLVAAGLAAGTMLSAVNLVADDAVASSADQNSYVAVPMHMFKRLTSNENGPKAPEFYTYQAGKLVKCTTDLDVKLKEKMQKCDKKSCDGERGRRGGRRGDFRRGPGGDIVLLTKAQLTELRKQKLENRLKSIENGTDPESMHAKKNSDKSLDATVNGQSVSVEMVPPPVMNRGECGPCGGLGEKPPVE